MAKKKSKTVRPRKKIAKKRNAARKPSGKPSLKKKQVKKGRTLTKSPAARKTSKSSARASVKPRPDSLSETKPRFAGSRARTAGQSGDIQGISRSRFADSESVAELLEEGNAFEADAVAGVEAASVSDEEVHTHEVPEDDVPEEYLDED